MNSREVIADAWGRAATAAQILARLFGFLSRTSDSARKSLETFAARARSRSTGVPLGVDLAPPDWLVIPDLPVARSLGPPPLPAHVKTKNEGAVDAALDEERHWQALILKARSQEAGPADAAADEWASVIRAAKHRPSDRTNASAAIGTVQSLRESRNSQ